MTKFIIITLALVAVAAAYPPGYNQYGSYSSGHDSGFERSQSSGFGHDNGFGSGLSAHQVAFGVGHNGYPSGYGYDNTGRSQGGRDSHEEHETHYSYNQGRGK